MRDPSLGAVILTQGDRVVTLERLVASVHQQNGDKIEIVVVCNGCPAPEWLAGQVKVVELPENLGVPAGRNVGVAQSSADVVMFLDDDAWFEDFTVADRVRAAFETDDDLSLLAFRFVDPVTRTTHRRHVPRLGSLGTHRPGRVTAFIGGACAVRRDRYEEVDGFAADFFYANEETDLAWRLIEAGGHIYYQPDIELMHPVLEATRHTVFFRMTARNKVWSAYRTLPLPLAAIYVLAWTLVIASRRHGKEPMRQWRAGLHEGWRSRDHRPRDPMSWKTIWKLTRLGRPPIV